MNTRIKASLLFLITMLATVQPIQAAEKFVSFSGGDWQLTSGGTVSIYVDANDLKGVNRAAQDLTKDIQLAFGGPSSVVHLGEAKNVSGTLVSLDIIVEKVEANVPEEKLPGAEFQILKWNEDREMYLAYNLETMDYAAQEEEAKSRTILL